MKHPISLLHLNHQVFLLPVNRMTLPISCFSKLNGSPVAFHPNRYVVALQNLFILISVHYNAIRRTLVPYSVFLIVSFLFPLFRIMLNVCVVCCWLCKINYRHELNGRKWIVGQTGLTPSPHPSHSPLVGQTVLLFPRKQFAVSIHWFAFLKIPFLQHERYVLHD